MEKIDNDLSLVTTGAFELRDPISDVTFSEKTAVEAPETSFVTQMIALKRLKVIDGKPSQETTVSNLNPSVGEALPVKDNEQTIKEIVDAPARRGRPAKH